MGLDLDPLLGQNLFSNFALESFPASAVAEAQQLFELGLTFTWAYDRSSALGYFQEAQRKDPQCSICFWGEAMSHAPNINYPVLSSDELADGRRAVDRAHALASSNGKVVGNTEMNTKLIDALRIRFPESIASSQERHVIDETYATALGSIAAEYPSSTTAGVLYAEALMVSSSWDYWEKMASQTKPEKKPLRPLTEF